MTSTSKLSALSEDKNVSRTPTVKPKGRFQIGLFAKRRKLLMEHYMQEKVEAAMEVKRLKARVGHAKRRVNNLQEEMHNIDIMHPKTKKARVVYTESKSNKENTDNLTLSRAQQARRRISTIEALKPIHCSTQSINNTPVLNGMWSTVVHEMSTDELHAKVKSSSTLCKKVIPNILKEHISDFQKSDANMTRSIMRFYKGGIVTKNKYKEMRKENFEFMHGIPVPKLVSYDRLQGYMKSINMGEVRDLQEFASMVNKPPVPGCYRPLENHLLQLADMYLTLNQYHKILHWFNEEGTFLVALGADGAPFGKDETATAFLVSFLNILDGVQSCNNNFLLMGVNCDETDPLMFAYTNHLFREMKQIEGKKYKVKGKDVKFQCKMIPSDQKWIASMAGELNNAAKYFSSYGNVSKDDLMTIGGTLGIGPDSTWKPWNYERRLKDAQAVSDFKRKKKIEEFSKNRNDRSKVTTFISSIGSRQEFVPYLEMYVDEVKPEPLHNTNNAWQAWNSDILTSAMKMTGNQDLAKANGNIDALSRQSALAKYLSCLEGTMKATRLAKNVRKWFAERNEKSNKNFQYRFTGKESKIFCWYFAYLCKELKNTTGITQSMLCHVTSLAYSGLCLRNSVALYSRVHITEADIDTLHKQCELYFNCQVLMLGKTTPTAWTIGKAIPYYTSELHKELGYGLGLNSMQGREAKHARLSSYSQNTTRGKRLRWWQIFKHEYMETIWLRLHEPTNLSYRRGCVVGDEAPRPVKKELYIPSWCNSTSFCYCGLPLLEAKCDICNSEMFKLIKESCENGKVNGLLKSILK